MKILFCGGGALGSHALQFSRGLQAEFSVLDFDRVETRNLASQAFVKQSVGKNKAAALKLQMLNFHGLTVRDYAVRLTAENAATILGAHDLLVDTFDNADSRALVQTHARQSGVSCVHAGLAAHGEFAVVRWDADFVIDREPVAGQATCQNGDFLPVIVMAAAALAHSIQRFVTEKACWNWNLTPRGSEAFRTRM